MVEVIPSLKGHLAFDLEMVSKCLQCESTVISKQKQQIMLSLPVLNSVEEGILQFFKEEHLTEQNKYCCSTCSTEKVESNYTQARG